MLAESRSELIRRCFGAYMNRDRKALENLMTDDFTFTSPCDDGIDKAAYFERCWPHDERVLSNTLETIISDGDAAFVTYLCRTNEGTRFRNTEYFTFYGDKIKSIDVYFGASSQDHDVIILS